MGKQPIGRKMFALGMLKTYIILFGSVYIQVLVNTYFQNEVLASITLVLETLIMIYCAIRTLTLSSNRIKHIGHSGNLVLLVFVPLVNLLFVLYLLVKKGKI